MGDKSGIQWTDATWNPVPEWDGFFVTVNGDIKGPSGQILKPRKNDTGHLYVTRGRSSRKLYVHRAVLLAFTGIPSEGREARHLNGVPSDNRLFNLKWGTRKEQREDDRRHGVKRGRPQALSEDVVSVIRAAKGKASSRVVGRQFGVSHTAIQRIWRGDTWNV